MEHTNPVKSKELPPLREVRSIPLSALVIVMIDLFVVEYWVLLVHGLWPGASIRPMMETASIFLFAIVATVIGFGGAMAKSNSARDKTDKLIAGFVFLLGLSVLPVFLTTLKITANIVGYKLSP